MTTTATTTLRKVLRAVELTAITIKWLAVWAFVLWLIAEAIVSIRNAGAPIVILQVPHTPHGGVSR